MPDATVTFHGILQDTQVYASWDQNEDLMVSVLFFALEVDGKKYDDMQVEVSQPAGTEYQPHDRGRSRQNPKR